MTREDAIKTLKELWRETNDPWYEEVYNMAVNALEADRKTKPQSGYYNECKWYGDRQVCGRCRSRNLYAPKTEPYGVDGEWNGNKNLFNLFVYFCSLHS